MVLNASAHTPPRIAMYFSYTTLISIEIQEIDLNVFKLNIWYQVILQMITQKVNLKYFSTLYI